MQELIKQKMKKISLYEIALDMGLSEGTLRRYLYGHKLKDSTIEIIKDYFKCIIK